MNMSSASVVYTATTISIANMLGMGLNVPQIIAIVFSSTFVSIAAASLPAYSLVYNMAVMTAIGVPLEYAIPVLAPLASLFWLQDRLIAFVNVESDIFAAVSIQRLIAK